MNIDVTFRHLKPTKALRDYAEEKAERAGKYLEEPISAHMVLEVERDRHCAHVTVNAHGISCQAKMVTRDMYSAIDGVMDKIEKQLSRQKGRRERREEFVHHRGLERLSRAARGGGRASGKGKGRRSASAGADGEGLPSEGLPGKPMSIEEAVLQIERTGDSFLVFRNDQSEEVNVVYRRKDGSLALIDPAL